MFREEAENQSDGVRTFNPKSAFSRDMDD